jgi:hypothetical protein
MLTHAKSTSVPVKILKSSCSDKTFFRVGQMSIHNKKRNALQLLT